MIVEARGLCRDYGRRRALDGLDLDLRAGEAVAVYGPNGAGKSTLLRLLTLTLRPGAGSLRMFGHDALRYPDRVRPLLGLVSHRSLLYDELNALENLEFFARLYGVTDGSARAERLLDSVGLGLRAEDAVGGYSRGMRQRLALARAVLHRPRLLLLDEPFSGLDLEGARSASRLLADHRSDGGALLLVGHDPERGARLCERFVLLERGRVALAGAHDTAPREAIRERLLGLRTAST